MQDLATQLIIATVAQYRKLLFKHTGTCNPRYSAAMKTEWLTPSWHDPRKEQPGLQGLRMFCHRHGEFSVKLDDNQNRADAFGTMLKPCRW